MQQKKLLSLAVSTALGLSTSVLLTSNALAQDQADQSADQEDMLEEVIVTGSRIARVDGFGATSPVTVVGMEDITSTGLTRVEDVLNGLPQIETNLHAFDANGITGTASIDLRGLGPFRTLVLMNGRRFQPGGVIATSVDVNQIPSAMIERVEVLTGGASATYGADAVAGVVNFIMRRVDGVELSVGASGYQHDNSNKFFQDLMDKRDFVYPTGSSGIDGKSYNVDIIIGKDFDDGRGNATVWGTWREGEALLQGARDYGSCALSSSSTSCGGSGNAIIPNFYIAPAFDGVTQYDRSEFVTLQPDNSFDFDDGTNRYNYAPVNHFMRPDTRWSMGTVIDYEINEHAIVFFEGNYATDKTQGQIAESGTFFNEEYFLPYDNSLFPQGFQDSLLSMFDNQYCTEFGDDGGCAKLNYDGEGVHLPGLGGPGFNEYGIYIGKRNVEGGPRASNYTHDGFRMVTGLKGAINDNWDYEASYLYGQTDSSMAYINDFFAPRITIAVDGEACAAAANCVPYEVFTYEGVTPEMAAPLLGTGVMKGQTSTRIINGFVSGDLGWNIPSAQDSVMVVLGVEHRIEKYERISDEVFSQGLLLGQGGPTPSVGGSYTVAEIFGEANIPLVTDVTGFQNLVLDLAYRYSDYSTAGGTSTYRVGLDWQPIDMLRVRTGYNRAVRAPNVVELFSAAAIGLWSGVDPCANDVDEVPVYTEAQCANLGVSSSQYGNIGPSPAGQYNALYSGNEGLGVETADTFTLGVVINPMDTMTISVDYWDIQIDDTITNIGGPTVIEQCGLFGILCENVNRSASGSLWKGTAGYIIDPNVNIGATHYEGIDVAFNWVTDGLAGTWSTNLIGTYLMTKETTPYAPIPSTAYDCVGLVSTQCYPSPDWRHTADVAYDSNEWWSLQLRWRYFAPVDYDGSTDTIAQEQMDQAYNFFDLNAVFRWREHDLVVGVNNFLDTEPPAVGGTLNGQGNANTFAGFYDTLGRYLFANATFRF